MVLRNETGSIDSNLLNLSIRSISKPGFQGKEKSVMILFHCKDLHDIFF